MHRKNYGKLAVNPEQPCENFSKINHEAVMENQQALPSRLGRESNHTSRKMEFLH
jgi:hypothetical protein